MTHRGKEIPCLFDPRKTDCKPERCGMYGWNAWAVENIGELASQQVGSIDETDEALTLSRLAQLQKRKNIQPLCPHSPDPDAFA